jgi:DNA-binding NtrC family response regulator
MPARDDVTGGNTIQRPSEGKPLRLAGVRIVVTRGPDKGAELALTNDEAVVGTSTSADLRLSDPTVSRNHVSVRVTPQGYLVTDLESTNGVRFADRNIQQAYLELGDRFDLGATRLRLVADKAGIEVPQSERVSFGRLEGQSPAARQLFALLERIAPTESTVLIGGETGTGKDLLAEALHDASSRRDGPFVVFDCGACAPELVESELFGHERGAFSGADRMREGAFETADGGTIFLDEIGELPLALQPKLLRALESGEVRRLGASKMTRVDVRVIAATHRDLKREVNRGAFREDLFYRLHVISVRIPPLRDRMEDVPLLARSLWRELTGDPGAEPSEELIASLLQRRWPGNVRELRNRLERAAALGARSISVSRTRIATYREAKAEVVDEFERRYLTELLARAKGNVSEAARLADMSRVHLTKLLQQYEIARPKR